jgi:hypothetical protein
MKKKREALEPQPDEEVDPETVRSVPPRFDLHVALGAGHAVN